MAFEVRRLPGEPIVIVTFTNPFQPANDVTQSSAQAGALLQDIQGTSYRIIDASSLNITFDALVEGLYHAAHSSTPDPSAQAVLVGSSAMVALASKAMGQRQYGAFNVPLYASLDEALSYARACLKK